MHRRGLLLQPTVPTVENMYRVGGLVNRARVEIIPAASNISDKLSLLCIVCSIHVSWVGTMSVCLRQAIFIHTHTHTRRIFPVGFVGSITQFPQLPRVANLLNFEHARQQQQQQEGRKEKQGER